MTHPYLSVQAEKEAGGFAEKGITNVGWAHWRPAGLCARFYSCLFVPLRLLVSLLALLNLFHRPSPLPCDFPGVELRGEADES